MNEDTFLANRQTFLTAGGIGAAVALLGAFNKAEAEEVDVEVKVDKNKYTEAEKANEKIVNDFCAAWDAQDAEKVASYMAEDIAYRQTESTPPKEGRDKIMEGFEGFLKNAKSVEFEVVRSVALGNIVIHDRVDRIEINDRKVEFRIVGVFYVNDGKILEWRDYSMPDA